MAELRAALRQTYGWHAAVLTLLLLFPLVFLDEFMVLLVIELQHMCKT